MPDETKPEKPRVKTWKTIKRELDDATAKVMLLTFKLDAARAEALTAKLAADAMAAQIAAELKA